MSISATEAIEQFHSPLSRRDFHDRATKAIATGQSLPQLLLTACAERADEVVLHSMGRDYRYRELEADSAALAAFLRQRLNLTPGARVALMVPNLLQFPVAALAVMRADLVLVPVNPLYTARELAHQLKDSGAEVLIVLEQFAAVVEQALPGTAIRQVILTQVGDMLPWPKSMVVNFMVRHVKKMIPAHGLRDALSWPATLAAGRTLSSVDALAQPTEIVQLQYTGGTTGLSKGAALTHQALMANVAGVEQWLGTCLKPGQDNGLIALPLYHIAAFSNFLYGVCHGIRGILIVNARDIPALVDAYARHRPAVFTGVNTLYDAVLNVPKFASLDHSGLKLSVQGGTALRRRTAEEWQRVTGCRVVEMYGLSETCGGMTANHWDVDNPVGSIGQPLVGVQVCLFDEQGQAVAVGESGELCIRGAPLLREYWGHPDETRKAFFDGGWFRTGDIARQDEHGYLFLLDRRKDMILVSGFNVFPNEIEDTVALFPGVLEAAAVAVPDDKTGEAVKLFVVRRDPALTEEALRAHCRAQLTGYKQPRWIEFRDSLPKSAVGKVLRRELRNL